MVNFFLRPRVHLKDMVLWGLLGVLVMLTFIMWTEYHEVPLNGTWRFYPPYVFIVMCMIGFSIASLFYLMIIKILSRMADDLILYWMMPPNTHNTKKET